MFPSSRAVHTNPGSASTTRLSSFPIPGPFGIVAVTQGCATLRATSIIPWCRFTATEAIALPENIGTLDEIPQFPDVARPPVSRFPSSWVTRFVNKLVEAQDGDVPREGIRALS